VKVVLHDLSSDEIIAGLHNATLLTRWSSSLTSRPQASSLNCCAPTRGAWSNPSHWKRWLPNHSSLSAARTTIGSDGWLLTIIVLQSLFLAGYRSERMSTLTPANCSGLANSGVPTNAPGNEIPASEADSSSVFARPKDPSQRLLRVSPHPRAQDNHAAKQQINSTRSCANAFTSVKLAKTPTNVPTVRAALLVNIRPLWRSAQTIYNSRSLKPSASRQSRPGSEAGLLLYPIVRHTPFVLFTNMRAML
jgi:hypothetical protein